MSLLVAAILLGSATPVAEPTEPTEAKAAAVTRVVVLVPAQSDRRIDDVVASARADLPATEVELVDVSLPEGSRLEAARAAAREQDARGVFWFDLADADEYRVYLYLPARDVTLRRRVPEASESVEAAVETMWIIVRSSTISIAKGVAIEMETVDPATIEPPAPKPDPIPVPAPAPKAPPPAEPELIGLRLAASYYGLGYGRAIAWQSGAGLELAYSLHRFFALGVAYGVVAGMRVRDPAELRVLRHEVAAVLAAGGFVSDRVAIEGRLLPALELVQWRAPQSDTRGLQPAGKVAAELQIRIELVPRITFDLAAGADAAFTRYAFVLCGEGAAACSGDARRAVFAPWPVRPRARAGVSFAF